MLDAAARKIIDPPLSWIGERVAPSGLSANAVTLTGLVIGVGAAVAIACHAFGPGLLLLLLNRFLDGLDGAIARAGTPTAFGGYLDIVADFVLWALLPLGFAVADPQNAFPAAVLLASFIASGTTFLAHAILAAKTGEESEARGKKSFFHLGGLTEGTETIAFFVIVLVWPSVFPVAAFVFATMVTTTAIFRGLETRRTFGI